VQLQSKHSRARCDFRSRTVSVSERSESERAPNGTQDGLAKTLRRAKIPYFRIYDLRSTYATRLSAGGVADEWVTQMLRQSDAQVFKKYSQMKTADEARSTREAQPPGERNGHTSESSVAGGSIVHGHGAIASFVHSSCTVAGF